MTLTKRGQFWHFRFRFRGQEFSGSTKLTSHRDAKEYEAQFRARLALGEVGAAPAPSMTTAWLSWKSHAKGRVGETHLARAESAWRLHLEPVIGTIRADQVNAAVVATIRQRYLDGTSKRLRGGKRTQAGANTLMGYLRAVLRHVQKQFPRMILPEIPMPRVQAPVRAYVPQVKIRAFLVSVDRTANVHQSVAVRAMLFLGLREGEALGLRWQWFSDSLKTYTPGRTKGKESLPLPVPQELRVWLQALCWGVPPDLGLVLPSEDGKAHRAGFLRRAIARAEIPGITAHRLRTSCATLMALAGVPIPIIQRQLRHKDIRTTLRYCEVGSLEELQEASTKTFGVQNSHKRKSKAS